MDHHQLILDGVTKRFGPLTANDRVSLRVGQGTIHAVLGENGAGKTTLMNVLYGLYQPDAGRIVVGGREVRIDSPRAALRLGIGMVHQHFMLVGRLTVVENVVLGLGGQLTLDLRQHARRLQALGESFGFEVDPHEAVWKLPIGMQQRVEILKLLYHSADILILDEPTSVLTPPETGPFFAVLKRLTAAGKTILFITHKLEEVMAVADRVTVMRHGRVVGEVATGQTDQRALARLMVGRDVMFDIARGEAEPGRPMVELEDVRALNDRGLLALDGASFAVRAGEVLGVAGVDGNGQTEERKHRLRIGYVPEDRQRTGLVLDQSVGLNLILRNYRRRPFARYGFLDFGRVRGHAERLVRRYDVRLRDVDQTARYLSGGNQQKLILAREIEDDPAVLVVAQPTKGLDVGAIEFVQRTLLEQRRRGVAILYISTEIEHLMAVSDRVGVLFRGRLAGPFPVEAVTPDRLGMLMAGVAA
jgi:ABC-type uncharacterized transport system ATPase subunit